MDNEKLAGELIKLAKELVADRKVVKVNWNDAKSITKAERMKSRLENQGYTLVKTVGGLNTSELIYKLDD